MQRSQSITLLRWIAVLPAAAAGAFAVTLGGGLISRTVRLAIGATSESNLTFWLQLLVYSASAGAFVLIGTLAAPTQRRVVACGLAAISVLLSLLTHVVSQQHPGTTNDLHLAAETIGAVLALGWLSRAGKGTSATPT